MKVLPTYRLGTHRLAIRHATVRAKPSAHERPESGMAPCRLFGGGDSLARISAFRASPACFWPKTMLAGFAKMCSKTQYAGGRRSPQIDDADAPHRRADHLARLDFTHQRCADDVQRHRLARDDVRTTSRCSRRPECAQDQWPPTPRIAGGLDAIRELEHEAERTLQLAERGDERVVAGAASLGEASRCTIASDRSWSGRCARPVQILQRSASLSTNRGCRCS